MPASCGALATASMPSGKTESCDWTPFRTALFLTAGFRLLYSLVAALFSPFLTLDANRIATNFTENLIHRDAHPWRYALIGVWQRFDTIYYIHIARNGYDRADATVFYPLYPALIHLLSLLIRSELTAAILTSTIATFFLLWGAMKLFELDMSFGGALRAVVFWLAWPAAFIFFGGYPDSLLLALTVWSLYFARKRNWELAGGTALLSGLTKALGCFAALPLFYIGWKQRDRRSIVAGLAAAVGTAGYQLWLNHAGFPSPSHVYQQCWGTMTAMPWTNLIAAVGSLLRFGNPILFLNLVALVCGTWLSLSRRVPLEYRIHSLAAILLFLTKRTEHRLLQSSVRYVLCASAVYPALALRLEGRVQMIVVLLIMTALNLLFLHTYMEWGLIV
jgi:hypothetical protein